MAKIFILTFVPLALLISGCNSFFYYPDSHLYYPPDEHGLRSPKEIELSSSDNVTLAAWLFKSNSKTKGTIIQFHGNAQNMSSHYSHLYWVTEKGFNLFTFDYSGYGVSESKPTPLRTVQDGEVALKKAYSEHLAAGGGKFIVYAESLGGIIALRSLENVNIPLDLLVLDSTFSSYKRVAYTVTKSNWLTWMFSPLVRVFTSDKLAPTLFTKKSFAPTIVIHSQYDSVVPYSQGLHLYQELTEPKELWTLENKGHVGTFQSNENRIKFIDRVEKL
ncbi:MAG: alpha/beta hydrolase [Bdellovibrionales bacterium]|nr:alpha/beta hydrolase [Bdellovibrionales bacterium]